MNVDEIVVKALAQSSGGRILRDRVGMALTILEGSTFCICDERGDICGQTGGFFAEDTRFLSLFRLTMNGETPLLLSSGKVEHFSAAFYLRNPLADGLPQDSLAIVRERFVARRDAGPDRRRERHRRQPVSFELAVEVASDFADIFAVKEHDFALGDPMRRQAAPRPGRAALRRRDDQLVLVDARRAARDAGRLLGARRRRTAASSATGSSSRPRERWELARRRRPLRRANGRAAGVAARFGEEQPCEIARRLAAPRPRLTRPGIRLQHSFERSRRRSRGAADARRSAGSARLPAAGMPWFMTVFGRDTLITSYQTLLLGPELARGALDVLAELQATEDDPSIDAEPGKIVHEVRRGKAAEAWFRALLRDGRRDAALPRAALRGVALDRRRRARRASCASRRCARSAGSTTTAISTATASSSTSGAPSAGSRTSRGRTPATRSASPTAGLPSRRSRPSRCRATSTTRSAGTAELAREVWGDPALAERLEREAAELRRALRRGVLDDGDGTTRSRSTATKRASTRSARTSATCSGAGSSRTSASTRSSTR